MLEHSWPQIYVSNVDGKKQILMHCRSRWHILLLSILAAGATIVEGQDDILAQVSVPLYLQEVLPSLLHGEICTEMRKFQLPKFLA